MIVPNPLGGLNVNLFPLDHASFDHGPEAHNDRQRGPAADGGAGEWLLLLPATGEEIHQRIPRGFVVVLVHPLRLLPLRRRHLLQDRTVVRQQPEKRALQDIRLHHLELIFMIT